MCGGEVLKFPVCVRWERVLEFLMCVCGGGGIEIPNVCGRVGFNFLCRDELYFKNLNANVEQLTTHCNIFWFIFLT